MNRATKFLEDGVSAVIRRLVAAIPTRMVAESFACDAVLFWVVAYCQNGIEPSWLVPVMQGMIGFDMLLTLARAYKRQAKARYLDVSSPLESDQPPVG